MLTLKIVFDGVYGSMFGQSPPPSLIDASNHFMMLTHQLAKSPALCSWYRELAHEHHELLLVVSTASLAGTDTATKCEGVCRLAICELSLWKRNQHDVGEMLLVHPTGRKHVKVPQHA